MKKLFSSILIFFLLGTSSAWAGPKLSVGTPIYGLTWNENGDNYTRTDYLASVAVGTKPAENLLSLHQQIRRCILSDAGVVQYYLCATDSTLKSDCITASDLTGAAGQVMVEIPAFYQAYSYAGTTHTWRISQSPRSGFTLHPAFTKDGANVSFRYIGAYEGILYDTSATRYTNEAGVSSKSLSFTSGTKTIAKLTGSVATVNMTGAAPGSGYSVGNVLTLAGGTVGATVTVATIGASGEVLTVTLTTKGYGHTTGVKATAGGGGTNCTVNIATLEVLTNPFTGWQVGDNITVSGTAANNGTYTIATAGDASVVVTESLADEAYALTASIATQKNWTATTGDVLSSVSGKMPITLGTRAQFRAVAATRGTGWRQLDYDLYSAIQLLYLVEYASFYTQSKIGAGITNVTDWTIYNSNYPISRSGNSNVIGNATGNTGGSTSCATEATKYMSYRGIEQWYGHLWKFVDGININANVPYVSNTRANFADNTSTNYTNLGVTLGNADGWQSTLAQISRGFLPLTVGASSSTKITDYYYQNTGWRVVTAGGNAFNGADAGAFYVSAYNGSGVAYTSVGGRLCY